ncbi:lysylphosphatidylglycerol synthase domain-containing protein [Polymorphobacter megasporae]|nr:lysylphosphatidylglycerol synthase domain-containing protein [Polymorphobacter megasporae]
MTRVIILLLTVVGLIGAALIVGSVGVEPVIAAIRAIGVGGYVVYVAYTAIVLGLLGAAWRAVAPGGGPIGAYVWARTVREGATDVLPFAQIGGLVVGGRALTAQRVPSDLAYASMIADLTTEMASQLIFTLFGVGALLLALGGGFDSGGVLKLVLGGLGLTCALLAALAFGQQPMLSAAARIGERLLPASVTGLAAVQSRLAAIYRDRAALAWSFGFNLAAWVASGIGAWLALRLMGVAIGPVAVLAIESLIFAVRSIAFVVPGALGVQEGAYLLLAPLFGLDPQVAVALSLLKRARDLTIGVPALLWWQASEGRKLLA